MVPRIVISAFKGMSGKTLISLAVMRGLRRRGLRVAPFKIGPDYIDPSYHRWASQVPSRNLDVVLMGEEGVLRRFLRYSAGADVAVVEGVLGLYDSVDGVSELGSTAQVAKLLKAPVVLVLNADRINRTLRAVVRGLKAFDPAVKIPGVIFTNVTPRQAEKLVKALPEEGVEVLGVVPKSRAVAEAFSYRHLGLVPMAERSDAPTLEEVLDNYVEPYIDLERLVEIAKSAEELGAADLPNDPPPRLGCRVGVVMDGAFNFYYPELLEEAEALGEVVYTSAVRDSAVPDVDVLIIGGGFPELLAERLERNKAFRKSLLSYIERGGRLYAECGGLMYLTSSIVIDRSEYEMVGAIDGVTYMLEKPVGKGYVWGEVVGETPIAPPGTRLKGHEFHYSKIALREKVRLAIRLERGVGVVGGWDGVVKGNMHAQYMHIHPQTYSVIRQLCRST
ncbi:MAG: hydrogenobyrinic acid a,c-diamide synthase (glutamine-hydrolyzing) [Pyrobaculum arsenaticum]|uniref:Cobyrinate a,c-diamide synthase n=2 Tax=Pyrobaculum arsenaticum TaxID=121277 RepID=A4WK71_PYRAR|nr:cobyrinate a,c-diamide synthase [Pyrobaculum arsenaticum]ABP50788.1 cobyrinate a,c-diamide synthase / hydrogenobyrinic acid a,c-diamide synthase (glutamine-hydrolysing) [Pyrobaculum arsenaticum DSM 13514]MCY0891794.1 hydrogenobyrinic acid a,c-diamide synthase (glutamine-hydrolyzing) [Pyrobaculum arsenaticum]NYR15494.1 hydrogenobyrinic acid a,c-diamide synthase (glutamine-hydrolyzing) [Pyrobaculum arsenaticum]